MALDQVLAQGPATDGVVVSSADHHAVEAEFSQIAGLPRPDVYLTTQVRPLAVNGVPLAQLVELPGQMVGTPPPDQIPSLQDDLRQLVEKFTGIQGYDLAHGQFPDFTGFDAGFGSSGPGPNEILGPPGRLLDAHDANSLNVLIPWIRCRRVQGAQHLITL